MTKTHSERVHNGYKIFGCFTSKCGRICSNSLKSDDPTCKHCSSKP